MPERFTQLDVDRLNAKIAKVTPCPECGVKPPGHKLLCKLGNEAAERFTDFKGPERELQEKIKADLRARRWYVIGSIFGVRSTVDAGCPDIIAAAPNGVTWWIEVKKKGAKLSEKQVIVRHVLLALGHRYAEVRSFEEFLRVVTQEKAS